MLPIVARLLKAGYLSFDGGGGGDDHSPLPRQPRVNRNVGIADSGTALFAACDNSMGAVAEMLLEDARRPACACRATTRRTWRGPGRRPARRQAAPQQPLQGPHARDGSLPPPRLRAARRCTPGAARGGRGELQRTSGVSAVTAASMASPRLYRPPVSRAFPTQLSGRSRWTAKIVESKRRCD